MDHSSYGSIMSDTGSSDQPSRRRFPTIRRRGLISGCALALTVVLLPASAHADPQPSESDLQAKVDKLAKKVEVLTEEYNGQRLELKEAKKDARQARERSEKLNHRLKSAREGLAEIAASRYKSGRMGQSAAVLASKDPQGLVDRATMVNHLSRQQAARLNELQLSVREAKQAKKQAEQAASKVDEKTQKLQKKKEKVEDLVAKTEDKLAEVRAENRAGTAQVDLGDIGSGAAARATEIALAQQGAPYVWGAEGPDSFDCSGLIVYAFRQVGVSLPHYTGALWEAGPHVSRSELRTGDLVFTSSHHVGIYVGGGQIVHAPQTGDVVKVSEIWSFHGAVRVT